MQGCHDGGARNAERRTHLGVLEQLLGNIGKFNSKPKDDAQPGG